MPESIHRDPAPQRLVYGALLLVQIFFGLHYLAAKAVLEEIPPGPPDVDKVVEVMGRNGVTVHL